MGKMAEMIWDSINTARKQNVRNYAYAQLLSEALPDKASMNQIWYSQGIVMGEIVLPINLPDRIEYLNILFMGQNSMPGIVLDYADERMEKLAEGIGHDLNALKVHIVGHMKAQWPQDWAEVKHE